VPAPKRLTCAECLRPLSTCICRWITPADHVVEVVVLQHPLEVGHAKGSARLLHLSLPNSALTIGEEFDPDKLQTLICGSLRTPSKSAVLAPKHSILLYPDSPQAPVVGMPAPPAMAASAMLDLSRIRLIVLDGTWRKSRKMLYLNPLLQQLPRLALCDMPVSHYRIRKAHKPDQLSTLEATCAALAQLEGNAEAWVPLLAAFDGFVSQQSEHHESR
jgi:DTW domain-containing protein YfiP